MVWCNSCSNGIARLSVFGDSGTQICWGSECLHSSQVQFGSLITDVTQTDLQLQWRAKRLLSRNVKLTCRDVYNAPVEQALNPPDLCITLLDWFQTGMRKVT